METNPAQVASRRQAVVIATLSEAVSNMHRGLRALREENAELRAENSELRDRPPAVSQPASRDADEVFELLIEAGPLAPSAARRATAAALSDRVTGPVLANAELVVSELVTSSVHHSGVAPGDDLLVRLRMWQDRCRLEVEDPGGDGAIVPRESGPDGIGLRLVQALSERWGLVRAADGPTRVWAQMRCGAAPRAQLRAV